MADLLIPRFGQHFMPEVDIWKFMFENEDRKFPDHHVLFVDGVTGDRVTFEEHRSMAQRFGSALQTRWNWTKTDTLLVFSKNHIDLASITAGVYYTGGIYSAAPPAATIDELIWFLKDTGAKAMVVHIELSEVASAAAEAVGIPEDRILYLGTNERVDKAQHWTAFSEEQKRTVPRPLFQARWKDAVIVYTSGTSGKPKGVMLTHYAVVSQMIMVNMMETHDASWDTDKGLIFAPLSHIYAFMNRHVYSWKGLCSIIIDGFSLPTVCGLIQENKVTRLYAVPGVLSALAQHPLVKNFDLSSLRSVMCAGSPLHPTVETLFSETFGVCVKNSYGLTEFAGMIASTTSERLPQETGSVGSLAPNCTGKILDLDGRLVTGSTRQGSLLVKGPSQMTGYKNVASELTTDGYFDTGDYVTVKDGIIKIIARTREMIRFQDEVVSPTDIEAVLNSHDMVADSAVVGIPGESGFPENPYAFVVLHVDGEERTAIQTELQNFVDNRLPIAAHLRGGVKIVNQIPRTPAGKILRAKLMVD